MKTILEPIIALAAVIGIVLGGLTYFATAKDLQMVEMRLDQKIVTDSVLQTRSRVWQLEEQNQNKPVADWQKKEDREEYKKIKEELKDLEDRRKQLMQK